MTRSTDVNKLRLWQQRMSEFQNAHMTIEQFCKQLKLSPTTFYYWRDKLKLTAQNASQTFTANNDQTKSAISPLTLSAHDCVELVIDERVLLRMPTTDKQFIIELALALHQAASKSTAHGDPADAQPASSSAFARFTLA